MNDLEMLHEVLALVAKAVGKTPEALQAEFAARRAQRARRAEAANERYEEALTHVTPAQVAVVERLRCEGARLHSRIRQNRRSSNIVLFLQAQKFNSAKSRVCTKLYAVYPDGTHAETFEKTISVRSAF